MSFLDPRAGHSRDDAIDVPATYAPDVPGAGDADSRRPASLADFDAAADAGGADGLTGADGRQPVPAPVGGPAWDAPTAATSTSQAEWELAVGTRPRGRRRARTDPTTVSRAGRNLPAAIGVGLGLGVVIVASLFIWPPAVLGVIAAAASVGIWEMVRALRVTGANPPLVPLIGGGLLMIGLAEYGGADALLLGLVATVLAAIVWRAADGLANFRRDLTSSVLIAVYVPFLLGFAVLLADSDDGPLRVIAAVLAVALSDTGGYAAGVFFGKHSMAPTISPKKSWEGFAGSLAAAAVGSSVYLSLTLDVPFYWGLLFGAVISAVAVTGDLAESMLKRDLRIKDMSRLLPGHGGLMDRLDSILFAVPTAFLLLSLIAPR